MEAFEDEEASDCAPSDCEVRVRLAVVVDNKRLRNDFKVQGSLAEREEKLALLHCVS